MFLKNHVRIIFLVREMIPKKSLFIFCAFALSKLFLSHHEYNFQKDLERISGEKLFVLTVVFFLAVFVSHVPYRIKQK